MKIIKEGIVFKKEDGPFRYNAWSTVCRDKAGKLYAAWSGERVQHVCPFGKNLMAVSEDGGETWSCPMIINDTWLDDRDAGITDLGDGKLIVSYFHNGKDVYLKQLERIEKGTEEYSRAMTMAYVDEYNRMPDGEFYRAGSYTRLSRDGGKTWEPAYEAPITSPHGPILLNNGKLGWLGRGIGSVTYRNAVYYAESADYGKTWEVISEIEQPDDVTFNGLGGKDLLYCEPDIVELDDGTLLGSIRVQTYTKGDNTYTMFNTFSYDGGKTWTKVEATNINGAPPHLLKLKDGRIVNTYGRRDEPHSIRGIVSCDGGKTWGEEFTLSECPNRDLGYPSTVELDDGTLVTVYYKIVPPATKTAICYTKWTV